MKSCYFYIKPSDNGPNPDEIRKGLAEGNIQQKTKMLKELIKCLVNDDTYPPLIMVIITNIVPLLSKHPELRKILLLYWEVIQKSKSVNDPTLKDQMFLACNSLRNDLLSHNQYLRGRTLRLISRIMHKGVIEPLSSAITQNISHKSAYVRRNTVVCLYNVFMNFSSDVIGDIDEQIEQLLKTETDLSTKRNAFILLNKSNPAKAMDYLQHQINSQSLQDIGDILQLAILKVLKQKAREEPNNRAKFLKIISAFTYKASESVLLECSITSLAISNSVLTIKAALSSYVSILTRTNELNVKKIVLDKLQLACKNSNYIQDSLVEDLTKNLNTPSNQIKIKILTIVAMNLNPKISENLLKQLKKQINQSIDKQYLYKIIKTLEIVASKFPPLHKEVINFIYAKIFKIQNLNSQSASSIGRTIKIILAKSNHQSFQVYVNILIENFANIHSKEAIKEILNVYGNYFQDEKVIEKAIDNIRVVIGSLPITTVLAEKKQSVEQEQKRPKVHFRTKILEDGSYQQQMVEEQNQQQSKEIESSYFRKLIAEDSIVGGVFARNIGKMVYKLRKSSNFNKNACSILMVLCSLLRNYEEHIYEVDQATIDQITILIRKMLGAQKFINSTDHIYETKKENISQLITESLNQNEEHVIEKNPSDIVFFRQLKKGLEQQGQFDDEEVNQILNQKKQKSSFIEKLKSMVQLTGHFDPLYAESFVTVNKNDIFFEILLINTTKLNVLNVQIQFSATTEILVLEKAQSVNLRPFESVFLRTQIRFTSGQFGSIYGYISYDNQAGIEQPYLITQQIKIDFIQFIVPAKIGDSQFKIKWAQNQKGQQTHQTSITKEVDDSTANLSCQLIYKHIESQLHCLRVSDPLRGENENEQQQYFLSKSFYGKSKLGQDFLIIVTIFKDENIDISFNLRSKESAIGNMIMKKIKELNFKKILEDQEEEGQEN